MAITVDLGELGTVTIADQAIPYAKVVLDAYLPQTLDENGDVIPNTGAQYKAGLESYILDRGWERFKKSTYNVYVAQNPQPSIDQYLTLTPPP